MIVNSYESMSSYWERQIEFSKRALEVAKHGQDIQVHEDQLKLEMNLGTKVVCMATYRLAHSVTPDDFEPMAA